MSKLGSRDINPIDNSFAHKRTDLRVYSEETEADRLGELMLLLVMMNLLAR